MKKVYLFLAEGFEEIEAIATIDMLRRADIDVKSVAIGESKAVAGAHGVTVEADLLFADADYADAAMLILPGGMPGTTNLYDFAPLRELIIAADADGKLLAAICAAPSIYGKLGLLEGKEATCYPGFEPLLAGAVHSNKPVVVSDNYITSAGPGTVTHFALQIITTLKGAVAAEAVAKGMLI
jgi:4-methyl-5(b-hydroxyethyl)-thiazole monophosphate biosynthesis